MTKDQKVIRKNIEYCLALIEVEWQTVEQLLKKINSEQELSDVQNLKVDIIQTINKLRTLT